MKRALSFVLVVIFVFASMIPTANAAELTANKIVDTFVQRDTSGNVLKFELIKSGEGVFTLNYYVNNSLKKTYGISDGSATITVTDKTAVEDQRYTLHVEAAVVREGPATRAKDRWYHAGYIQYGYSSTFECNPIAVVSWKDTDSYTGTYYVNTYENSSYSDWIAMIASVLIGAGLGSFAPPSLAAGILAGMIGSYGAEVLNDIISIPFIEEYECSSVTYTMRAEVIGSGMDTDVVDYEGGVEYWIKYADAPDEYRYTGWTPSNWGCRDFAVEVWNDSVPLWPAFPGVVGYPTYI